MSDNTISILVPVLSSLATLLVSSIYYNRRMRYARLTNLSSIVQIEYSLRDIPLAYRFHGITQKEIRKAGITPQELAYLVANFTAGRIYDVSSYSMASHFTEDNYRYKLLQQPSTRRAWPLIKRMMTEDKYIKKLERTISIIENINTEQDWLLTAIVALLVGLSLAALVVSFLMDLGVFYQN